jgi:Bifunctional DNA primase/polymerase, N-terminal
MSPLEIALTYIARGWAPIPIPHKAKKPTLKLWQNLGITAETARQYFNGNPQNVGVQQGAASRGLADVDLDCLEAIAAAPFFLPHRTARFGRASKPCSHWLYYTDLAQTEDKATLPFKDPEKHVVLEIRIGGGGAGAQTVFPESTHPSGEAIEWVDEQDVAQIGGKDLKTACGRIAACSLIARHYPKVGGRHDAALVFGGFLARCGFSVSEVKLFAEAVAAVSGQPADKRRDIVKTAADCVEAFAAGREACGLNKMGETFGAAVAALCAKWLGYRASRAGGATGHDSAAPEGGGLNFTGVEAAILAAPKHEACAVFVRLAMDADLDAAQAKLLAKAAGAQSGAGAKLAEKMLDEARAQRREAAAQAIRDKAAAESTRERIEGIFADDEIGPILRLLDDILSRVDAPEPPMRDAEGWPVEVQCRQSAGLHKLTAEGANAEESAKSRLASPKHFLLTRHEKESLEIEWGDHLCFVQKTKDGEHYVAPPEKFLNHFLKYRRSKLPRAHAVLTMPLVLPDGSLLAGNGLDRKRRAVFRIDPALLAFMPKPEDCGPDEVAEAFKHLTDHWLVDVSTDLDGKCVLIALALSIIERVLFAERPVFFVTGGLRGGGKTTALMMIALAATGTKAAAAAWSSDPDERKKAIFSYLLECLPVLIWDNIPRGATIGCPHIERASTCEFYQDRVLGVTKTRTAPAYTILAFTGNNIGPKSDQASRSLEARLTTDRPDPENRNPTRALRYPARQPAARS